MTTIPAYAFRNLSTVNASYIYIFLANNHIFNIELHAFSGVENPLTYLHLDNNNLTHLPLALEELSSLNTLYLLGNPLVNLDVTVFANISNKLNAFSISVDRFARFPNTLRYVTALSALTVHKVNLPNLHSTVFHSFENTLTYLDMSFANFESIPAAVCRPRSLQTFISNFSPNLGKYNSSIFDECTHRLTTVTSLKLQYDQLTTIPKLINIFPKLETLYLTGNALHYIESSSLAGLTSLTTLDIGSNRFTRIPFAVNKAVNLRTFMSKKIK